MSRVERKAEKLDIEAQEAWRAEYSRMIEVFAARPRPFLVEDITREVGIPEGVDPRAIGPLVNKKHRDGLIVPTGRFPNGKSVSRHRTLMREWIGSQWKEGI